MREVATYPIVAHLVQADDVVVMDGVRLRVISVTPDDAARRVTIKARSMVVPAAIYTLKVTYFEDIPVIVSEIHLTPDVAAEVKIVKVSR